MAEIDGSAYDYYLAQRDKPSALLISAPALDRLTGEASFAVTRARRDAAGRFDGLFGISGAVRYFSEFYNNLRETPDDMGALIREDGTVLARFPSQPDAPPALLAESDFMTALRAGEAGLFTSRAEHDRLDRQFGYARVGSYPIYVAYGLSLGSVRASWRRTVNAYGAATIAAIALLLVAAELVRRNAVRARREQAAREAELKRREVAEEGLRRAQRLETVGRMTGGVAHDFNNLLQVLLVNIAVMRKRADPDDAALAKRLAAMDRAAQQGARLTRQLLAFSRRSSLRPARVELQSYLPSLHDLLHASLRSGIQLRIDVAGTVTLSASNASADALADVKCAETEMVVVRVTDTGHCIAPDHLAKIFEPFFTTKPVGQGTGLGLAQVFGFANQSGGEVQVTSELGRRTTFTLLLPLGREPSVVSTPAGPAALALRLLVVDDNPDTGQALTTLTIETGCSAEAVTSGAAALERLAGAPLRCRAHGCADAGYAWR